MIKIYMGWILIVASLISVFIINIFNINMGINERETMLFPKLLLGTSILVLWLWMLTDFFKRRDVKHRIIWGWMLILTNWLAATFYFIFVYFPRKKAEIKAEKIKIEKKGTQIPA